MDFCRTELWPISVATLIATRAAVSSSKNFATSVREPPQLPVTIVVTPMRTKFSAAGVRAIRSEWVCTSMNPGAATRPSASTTVTALPATSPMATIRCPFTAMFPFTKGTPVPSAMRAFWMSRSNSSAWLFPKLGNRVRQAASRGTSFIGGQEGRSQHSVLRNRRQGAPESGEMGIRGSVSVRAEGSRSRASHAFPARFVWRKIYPTAASAASIIARRSAGMVQRQRCSSSSESIGSK